MEDLIWSSSTGRIELQFRDSEQVHNMFHQGDCSDSVKEELAFFQAALDKLSRSDIVESLVETGGWTDDELAPLPDHELHVKLLWIAAGDLYEAEFQSEQEV